MATDRSYFTSRAEEEDAKAAAALNDEARDAHLRLARAYRDCAENRGPTPLADRPADRPRLTIL